MSGGLVNIAKPLSGADILARLEALQVSTPLTLALTDYVLDSVLVDSYEAAQWVVVLTKTSANRSVRTITASHDGSTGADATAVAYGDSGPDDVGTVDVTVSVGVSGVGAAQVMRLIAQGATTGWTASVWRLPMKPAQP